MAFSCPNNGVHPSLSKIGLVALALAALSGPALGAAPARGQVALELVSYLGGYNDGLFIQGQYAYTGFGRELSILDVSDPTHLTRVGHVLFEKSEVLDVQVAGSYAYVATADGYSSGVPLGSLKVIDVSDPHAPLEVTSCSLPGGAWALSISGAHVYLTNNQGLWVADISDPSHPRPVGACDMPGGAYDVQAVGGYAYLIHSDGYRNGSLKVVGISDPAHPQVLGSYNISGTLRGLAVAGQYAYVADNTAGKLRVVDVSDPAHPHETASTPILNGGDIYGVYVAGSRAYVAGSGHISGPYWYGGVEVVDISNPSVPKNLNNYVTPKATTAYDVYTWGDYVFLTTNYFGLLLAVDISDLGHPTEAGVYQVPQAATAIHVSGDYAYIADWGVSVVDVSDRASPAMVSSYKIPPPLSANLQMAVSGNYAYVGDYTSGLSIVSISGPITPTRVGHYAAHVGDVAVAGGYAYVADDFITYDSGLEIIDVSDPAHPVRASFYETPGETVAGVAVSGDYVYLGTGPDGLLVLDVSDPAHPAQVGAYSAPGSVGSISVSGHYAYVTFVVNKVWGQECSLRVLDMSDLTHPSQVGVYSLPEIVGWTGQVFVSDTYAYLATAALSNSQTSRLWLVDVSDPAHPSLVDVYDIPAATNGVYAAGEYVYVAADGLYILRLAPLAMQVAPQAVTWLAEAGGPDPLPQAVRIESTGRPLTWTAALSPSVGWLEAAPLGGVTPAVLTVTAHITGLGLGTLTTALVVESEPAVQGSPQIVPVTLIVAEEVHRLYLPLALR